MSSSEYMDKENVVHLYLQWNIIQPYYYYYVNSVMSDSQRPHGLQPTRLFHPWGFPGKSTGVGCHCLKQEQISFTICNNINGGGNGNPLQYSCLENPMDRGVWQAAVHGVAKSQT